MKTVTAFVGSAHRKNTHHAVIEFLDNLSALGGIQYEVVTLSDYALKHCRGCEACIFKGEEYCPLKDDRDVLMGKMMASEGVIFASPNYNGQVSGIMKTFIDRFAFVCHRPRYFGRLFTSIVTQAIGGGGKIVEYLDTFGAAVGFNVVKGSCITSAEPGAEKAQQKAKTMLAGQATRFHAALAEPAYPSPTLLKLMLFRMWRNIIRGSFEETTADYRYYAEMGWFKSDYYYPTHLGPHQVIAGKVFDSTAVRRMLG